MTPDVLSRLDYEPTRLQLAEDWYQQARLEFEQARDRWIGEGGPTAERSVVHYAARLHAAEDNLNRIRDAVREAERMGLL